ncbi:MAG: leucine-rich repeat domain-containing protein, partial [Bacteroidaceae bacterium]|nr:leucine-rich repeat domain-containing protein [Bacteroidaceae bacterium]
MRKFYLYSLLTALLLLCSTVASAHDFEVDGVFYSITSSTDKTVAVTYSGSYSGAVADEYSGIVTIPSTVTYNDVTYNVTSIGYSAFESCTSLTSVTIPNSVTTMGDYAFYGCTGLKSVTIPNSVTSIEYSAFRGCTGLTSITIPNSVTSIGSCAFEYCSGLTSVTIPNSVTSIDIYAFHDCTGLTSITIPNSVTSIGYHSFDGCTGLTSIVVDAGNSVYDSREGCNAIIETATNTLIAGCKSTIIPGSVTSIDSYAFHDCTGLTSITIPNSVTSIGSSAFSGCSGLTSITIPNSVTSIGSQAFQNCTGLTSVTIPNSVTSIENWAFYNCTGLTSITIPNSVTSIGSCAFEYCSGLTSVTIPNSVTSIRESAFNGCPLEKVEINTTTVGSWFKGCTSIKEIIIGDSVTSIGDYAFNGCTGIKNVRIEDGDTKLNLGKNGFKGLFYYCPLESLYLGRNLNYSEYYGDGYSPFAQITTLTSVTIGDNVNSLNTFLFKDCSNLNAITIPESVQIIEDYVFQYCDLREIHIPAGVITIGDYAFSHNNNLEKITAAKENTRYSTPEGYNVLIDNNTIYGSILVLGGKGAIIPDGIVSIGDGAFNGIHGITSITIPASVEAIGSYAFEACSDLKEIHCLATDRYISVSNFAFDGLYETTTLYIPAAGKKYYTGSWADFANIVVVGEIVVDGLSYAVISEEEKTVQVIDYSGSNDVVNIPSSITYNGEIYKVTAICYQAFKDYTNISGITIPASVSSIGYDAFVGCTNLASIKVESGNPVFDSRENCNAIIETATNTLIQGCKNTIIPNSVTLIGNTAFYNCTGLTSITIPNSVTSIRAYAFFGCSGLTSIEIPNSVTSIGGHAFFGCSGLTSVTIPNSVKAIGENVFSGCTSLTSVTIPSSVTSIGYGAFSCCSGLTIITIPNSVTRIGYEAFYGCTNLATVVNNSSLDIIAGSEDHGLVAYYADEVINNRGGSVIGDFVFNDSGNLIKYIGNESEITLPEKSPAGIKYGIVEAFQNNTKITSVIIPDSVSFIYNTFSGCTSLTSVTIGNGVHRIGEAAFQGCSALKDIYVNGIVPALLYNESFAEHYASATLHVPAGTKAAYQSSVSQREEMEIRRLPVYNNDLLASMSGCDKDAIYETVKVEVQNPDVAGTLNGNDYLLAYQPLKTKMTDLPKATFETSIARNGRYKIALVTAPWFIESYSDTLISSSIDPQYADSYLRVRVKQNNEQLAMFPCDSFNIGTSKTNFGVWEKHAIVPDRSRIDTIFLKDANNEDYIFDFVNNHSVDVNIELLRPLQYNER